MAEPRVRNLCLLALLSLSIGADNAGAALYGHQTVFRYRAYEDSRPSWVSPHAASGGIDHTAGSVDIHVIQRGVGFERMLSADFNGVSEYVAATSHVSTVDTENHDSFTIQAWFQAHATDGYRTLVSNTASNRGFSLKIRDGLLRGLVRIDRDGTPVHVEILGGVVQAGQWHHASLRVQDHTSYYELHLFLDGQFVGSKIVSHDDGILQSSEPPMVGAEPMSGAGTSNFFDGYIYAVSISNYAVGIDNYLEYDGIRDASRYFGMPSYHDYLSTTDGPDHRISATIDSYADVGALVTGRWYTPFSNDQYIPQGVASNGNDLLYLSMYWRETESDDTDQPHSIVAEVTTSGELRRVFQLKEYAAGSCLESAAKFNGHVGGAAWWSGFLYVPDGRNVLRYEVPSPSSQEFDPSTFANASFDNLQICADAEYTQLLDDCAPTGNASFLSIGVDWTGDPTLWIGQFDPDSLMTIVGYPIDSATGDVDASSPLGCFPLVHPKVQGVFPYLMTSDNVGFYVATSYGDNPSKIYNTVYSRSTGQLLSDPTDPPVFEGPAGIEDLAMVGDDLWTVSESGAKYYQKVKQWDDLFPFVFKIDANLFPTVTATGPSTPTRSGLRFESVSPNPFNPRSTLSFELFESERVRVDILNIRGERIVTLVDRVLRAGPHRVRWDGRDQRGREVSSGVYVARLQGAREAVSRKLTLVR